MKFLDKLPPRIFNFCEVTQPELTTSCITWVGHNFINEFVPIFTVSSHLSLPSQPTDPLYPMGEIPANCHLVIRIVNVQVPLDEIPLNQTISLDYCFLQPLASLFRMVTIKRWWIRTGVQRGKTEFREFCTFYFGKHLKHLKNVPFLAENSDELL